MVWFCVTMMPFCISALTTAATRSAMRLASSCTVMASGTCTSRTTFSRSPWPDPALLALLLALHRRHASAGALLVGGVADGQLAGAAAVVVALGARGPPRRRGRRVRGRSSRAADGDRPWRGARGRGFGGGRIGRRPAARGGLAHCLLRAARVSASCGLARLFLGAQAQRSPRVRGPRAPWPPSRRGGARALPRAALVLARWRGLTRLRAPWRPATPSAGARSRRPKCRRDGATDRPARAAPDRPRPGPRRAWARRRACACARP